MDRYEIAWRIYCWQEGYRKAEDREHLVNWMREPNELLTENDLSTRNALLEIADGVIEMAKEEYQIRRAFLIEIAEETCRLAEETLELVKEETQRAKPVIQNDPPPPDFILKADRPIPPGWAWGRKR